MTEEKPFSCQYWLAPDQKWVLNVFKSFSTVQEAKKYGKKHYKEFRVIEHGVVRYTRLYQDDVLVERVGAPVYLKESKGRTQQEALTQQESRKMNNTIAAAKLLGNISGILSGINIELSRMQYAARVMGHPALSDDIKRQRSLLGTETRRIENLSHKLETE